MSIVDELVAQLQKSAVPGQRTWAAYLRDCRLGKSFTMAEKFTNANPMDATVLKDFAGATHVLWPASVNRPGVLLLHVPTRRSDSDDVCTEVMEFCRQTYVHGGYCFKYYCLDVSDVVTILWRLVEDLCSKLPPDLKYWGAARDAWMRAVATAPALV
jgi:hypothetical protein